jgi:sugar diacid utilization regulator
MAVTAGPRRVGLLLLGEPVNAHQADLLGAAVVPASIEAVRRDTVATAKAESASRLIDEIRYGSLRDPDELMRAAKRFGLVLDRPHAAAVFTYDGPNRRTWATALNWIEMPSRQEDQRGWTILTGDVAGEVTRIRTRLQGMVGEDAAVLAAAGPVVVGVAETARSFVEAETVLALLRRDPERVELTHASLGLAGLLLAVPRDRLDVFVRQQLGPILDREDLLATLHAWLESNGSRAAVAERLDMHRNSVGYRIGKIRTLLAADPLDATAAPHLQAALLARVVLQAMDDAAADEG